MLIGAGQAGSIQPDVSADFLSGGLVKKAITAGAVLFASTLAHAHGSGTLPPPSSLTFV